MLIDAYCILPSHISTRSQTRPGFSGTICVWGPALIPLMQPDAEGWEVIPAHLLALTWKDTCPVHSVPWITFLFLVGGQHLNEIPHCSPSHILVTLEAGPVKVPNLPHCLQHHTWTPYLQVVSCQNGLELP